MTQQEFTLDDLDELELEDQSQEQSHQDFDNTPPEGITVGRFVGYIEMGKHDGGSYQGKKKADAERVRLEFELLGPDNWIEWEVEGTKHRAGQIVSFELKKSQSSKASFMKLFKKMQYGREDKKHMAKMLGEAFVINVYHNKKTKDGKERTYVNLHKDGEFGIYAPYQIDPLTKVRTPYDVPAATVQPRWLLWDKPQMSNWNSLFIDGTREVERDDGNGGKIKEEVSKNWLQEKIMGAKNFNGSKLQQLLYGLDNLTLTEPAPAQAAPAVAQAQPQPAAQAVPAQTVAVTAPVAQPAPAVASAPTQAAPEALPAAQLQAPADPMAALGLVPSA